MSRKQAAKVGRPRKGAEVRKVYAVNLPPSLAERAKKRAGGMTPAVEAALIVWLDQPS